MICGTMTLICVSLFDKTIPELLTFAERSKTAGADLIEIRMDLLTEPSISKTLHELSGLKMKIGLPVILTIRPKWEGGGFSEDEEKRLSLLEESIALGFDYIDLEFKIKESKRDSLITKAKENRVKTIISYHDYNQTPSYEEIFDLIKKCQATGGSLAKVVFKNNEFSDAISIMSAANRASKENLKFTALGMGKYGYISRVLAPINGCEIVYASLKPHKQVIDGQVDIKTLKEKMIFDNLDRKTKICGVIGNPLGQSLSPMMHNAAFKELGLNYVYLPFEIPETQLEFALSSMRTMGFRGFSVTLPFKNKVMKYLDHVDDLAQTIGAVNTVVNDDGKLIGYNTDAYGAFEALRNAGIDVTQNKTKVLILGAGGAARAVAVPLAKAGSEITVANRTFKTGERLAKKLNKFSQATAIGLDDISNIISDVKILINCTPVGMKGFLEDSPIPTNLLRNDMIAFDIVYSPKDTPLLTAAKKIGATIIYGYEMLILQGVKAFELWTGKTAPIELMRRVVREELEPNLGGP